MSARGRELKEAIAVVIGGTDGGSCCKLLFQQLLIFVFALQTLQQKMPYWI